MFWFSHCFHGGFLLGLCLFFCLCFSWYFLVGVTCLWCLIPGFCYVFLLSKKDTKDLRHFKLQATWLVLSSRLAPHRYRTLTKPA